MQLTFDYRTQKDIFGLEHGGGELMNLVSYDVEFLDNVFPSIFLMLIFCFQLLEM